MGAARTLVAVATLAYLAAVAYRLLCVRHGTSSAGAVQVSDAEALALADDELPAYTVLVPAYREPEVIGQLVGNLGRIDYPEHKLEVLLLLEEDDDVTRAAVAEVALPAQVRVLLVPDGGVRTKPNACNWGLLQAGGELVTIYDAEDQPDPLQLRRAAVAFRRLPADVVCVQARLSYFNSGQNLITRWFALEYVTWFEHLLPGLVALKAPIPLGGTSNHLRAAALKGLGGWDPYNVTEDADLGLRIARAGLKTEVLASVTLEEANSDFVNWVKQRSRWYKGYLQTWIVHNRHPLRLIRTVGLKGYLGFTLFVAGTPLLAALNPVFWYLAIVWFVAEPAAVGALFPGFVYYPAMVCFVAGNFAMIYAGLVSARAAKRHDLLLAALTFPAYWVMMSLAAVKAVVQLVLQPSYWEKTTHGLSGVEAASTGKAAHV
ncbi:glycosyltransferase [Motilibacter sp. E257]|uniref:Glycosyltransferase n=2 Tax=Motilibacter deserti TaxID=2714956 RepID=A0ABX0GRQ8_9ACTN|nr:glycosyltransferase [Motilibacter deserti]